MMVNLKFCLMQCMEVYKFINLNSVTGPYAEAIFIKELGLSQDSLMNCVPKQDFGGGHPDPNLTVR